MKVKWCVLNSLFFDGVISLKQLFTIRWWEVLESWQEVSGNFYIMGNFSSSRAYIQLKNRLLVSHRYVILSIL